MHIAKKLINRAAPQPFCWRWSALVVSVLLILGTFCSAVDPQTLVWRERAPLSLARAGYMAGVIDGRYVIAGGSYWVNQQKQWTDEVDVFDSLTNAWSQGARLPERRSDAASVVYENALYLFGGGEHDQVRRDALVFRDGRWQTLATAQLPEPRVYAIAIASSRLIYLFGGMSDHTNWNTLSNQLWVWNPKSGQGWKRLEPLPGPGLITAAVAEVKGRIYVLGGAKSGGKDVVNVNTAYEYDPKTVSWTQLPELSIERRCWWGLPLGDEILLFGGFTKTFEKEVFAYQPSTRALTKIGEMPHGLCDAKFFRIGNSIYGLGGESAPSIRGRWTLEAQLPRKAKQATARTVSAP